jgi:hypothetical protein
MFYRRFIPTLVKSYFYYDEKFKILYHKNCEFKCAKKLRRKSQSILESLKFSFTIYVLVPFHSIYNIFFKYSELHYTALHKYIVNFIITY